MHFLHADEIVLLRVPAPQNVNVVPNMLKILHRNQKFIFLHLLPRTRRLCLWLRFVYLFVCLSVFLFVVLSGLLATLLKKLRRNSDEILWGGPRVVRGTSDLILVVIQMTTLIAQSEILPLLNKLRADVDEIFRIVL